MCQILGEAGSSWAVVGLVLGGLVGGACEPPPQESGGALTDEQAAYDVLHYDLDVAVHPDRRELTGRVQMRAGVRDSLDTVVLDLDRRLEVVRAGTGDGTELPAVRRAGGNELYLSLPETHVPGDTITVQVDYRGSPREAPDPPWDGGLTWAQTPGGAPWIATAVQTEGADLWWPVKDHPSDEPDSMDVSITVPDSLVGASNGVLQRVEPATDSTATYHWTTTSPINTYNVTLNVAPYARIDTTYGSVAGTSVPVAFYVLPSDSARAAAHLPSLLAQVRFLEDTLGPYPFRSEKYGLAQTPFLGMEHQTLIAYGHDFGPGGLGYDASFDALHFHELAHEWYGNLVTVRDWKDFWLHEGPATYLEALYAEHREGDSAYHARIDYFRSQLDGGRPIAFPEPRTASAAYHRDVYFRGALVLHTLRYLVGEDILLRVLRGFLNPEGAETAPFRHVTTDEFVAVAEAEAERSLEAFFNVYLYQSGLPRLQTNRTGGVLTLKWEDTGEAAFGVPVPVRVDGTTRRVDMAGGSGQIEVPSGADVVVDPTGWVLRR